MTAPLMPKGTAVWLVDNTTLSFEQIADYCELHELEIQAIADGDVAYNIMGISPIDTNQLTWEEIHRCEKDSKARLVPNKMELDVREKNAKAKKVLSPSQRSDKPAGAGHGIRILRLHRPEAPTATLVLFLRRLDFQTLHDPRHRKHAPPPRRGILRRKTLHHPQIPDHRLQTSLRKTRLRNHRHLCHKPHQTPVALHGEKREGSRTRGRFRQPLLFRKIRQARVRRLPPGIPPATSAARPAPLVNVPRASLVPPLFLLFSQRFPQDLTPLSSLSIVTPSLAERFLNTYRRPRNVPVTFL